MIYVIILIIFFVICLYLVPSQKESKIEITKTELIMTYTPITIATYFLQKEKDNRTITPMKIIKLVYIAQGWYLALKNGNSLISENAEAWKYGPVIPSLYDRFRTWGSSVISEIPNIDTTIILKEDLEVLDDVWNNYGDKSGIQLSGKTHEPNTPWSKTWEKARETTKKEDLIIPNSLIMQHYQNLLSVK